MKLACCSWSYHRALESKRINFDKWLQLCAEELGVGGVDIIAEQLPRRNKRFLVELKRRCADARLSIVSLSPSNNFGKSSYAERSTEVEQIIRWVDVAFVLGAPCVRIFAGWPPRAEYEVLWPKMVQCIQRAAKVAAQVGILLVVEPHNHGGFLYDSRTTLRLIREVGSPWVRINLDTGNLADPDPYAGIEACLPQAAHVVAKMHDLTQEGEDTRLDYRRIFKLLKRHKYHGFVTLEYEGKADELAIVPRALQMLRKYALQYDV